MKNSRKALSLIAVLALAGCGAVNSPGADKKPVESDDKSPLAEYMGEGFSSMGGGAVRVTRAGGNESTEEQNAKQRKLEDSVAACMKTAGFEYVAVPPESNPKSKFNDAFNLPPDKFAEQYGYGISTIDWGKPDGEAEDSDPNAKIRKALTPAAQKAYDKALNGQLATSGGTIQALPADGKRPDAKDMGCRGKAAEEVFGSGEDKLADFSKFDSLFKDLEALRKRIDSDQRVVDATAAWTDCMADAGHAGFKKIEDARNQVQSKLNELTGTKDQPTKGGPAVAIGIPSLDKVDAAKLADLRKFEIELAKADQGCKTKVYDAAYKSASQEHEKEFVAQHKTELEQYRDTMAER
ncbi:hypothetical protein [Kribbella sp. NPDC051770]|uniref:hypothetical protein n=1 Tax=Kribbella sp. NPDC051770 TaxID=3155413 RepID=UPI003419BD95